MTEVERDTADKHSTEDDGLLGFVIFVVLEMAAIAAILIMMTLV